MGLRFLRRSVVVRPSGCVGIGMRFIQIQHTDAVDLFQPRDGLANGGFHPSTVLVRGGGIITAMNAQVQAARGRSGGSGCCRSGRWGLGAGLFLPGSLPVGCCRCSVVPRCVIGGIGAGPPRSLAHAAAAQGEGPAHRGMWCRWHGQEGVVVVQGDRHGVCSFRPLPMKRLGAGRAMQSATRQLTSVGRTGWGQQTPATAGWQDG